MKKFLNFCVFNIGVLSLNASDIKLNEIQSEYQKDMMESFGFDLNNYTKVYAKDQGYFYIDNVYINHQKFDGIKSYLAKGMPWEVDIKRLISKCVKPNTTVLDIGAHIGTHTVTMAKLVGPNGRVIAFEPQKKLFFELLNNMEANGISSKCILLPFAVSDQEEIVHMPEPVLGNEGGTGLSLNGDECLAISIDQLGLDNVSFIKMDVEGHENKALDGAKNTILKCKPILLIEILGGVNNKTATKEQLALRADTVKKIQKLGYYVSQVSVHDFLALPIN